jgi:hypothetical protein
MTPEVNVATRGVVNIFAVRMRVAYFISESVVIEVLTGIKILSRNSNGSQLMSRVLCL